MKALQLVYLRIVPDKFHFLKFILEGYDNLGILSSYSHSQGIVLIRYPEEMAEDLFNLLADLAAYLSKSTSQLSRIDSE